MAVAILYQADYRDTLAVKTGLVDLVMTSPPYCDARTYNHGVNWGLDDYAKLGGAVFDALKPGGHCLLNMDAPIRKWRNGYGTERGFHPWKVMLDWAERVGFRVPDRLAFGRMGLPGEYRGRFRNDWEPLLWFQKPGARGYFDKHSIARAAEHGNHSFTTGRRADGTLRYREVSGWAIKNKVIHRGTMWNYGAVGNQHSGAPDLEALNHPARFPFRLASDIVKCFSEKGGLVCDPFLGGGTSLMAALQHDRDFIGGDFFARNDGPLWVDLAAEVATDRYGGGDIAMFGLKDKHELTVVTPGGERVVLG